MEKVNFPLFVRIECTNEIFKLVRRFGGVNVYRHTISGDMLPVRMSESGDFIASIWEGTQSRIVKVVEVDNPL